MDLTDKEVRDIIVDAARSLDYKVRSYSGRCMYGKNCLGITIPDTEQLMIELAIEITEDQYNEHANIDRAMQVLEWLKDCRTDNMGREFIVYWPSIPAPENGDVDEEDEDDY